MLFGSELFEVYIGQLAMASMASLDIFTEGEQLDTKKLQEKMRVRSNSIPLFIINWTLGISLELLFFSLFLCVCVLILLCLIALKTSLVTAEELNSEKKRNNTTKRVWESEFATLWSAGNFFYSSLLILLSELRAFGQSVRTSAATIMSQTKSECRCSLCLAIIQ